MSYLDKLLIAMMLLLLGFTVGLVVSSCPATATHFEDRSMFNPAPLPWQPSLEQQQRQFLRDQQIENQLRPLRPC